MEDLDRGNVIQDLNQNSRKMSSYALLCNENVMEWTNGVVVHADPAHAFDLELGTIHERFAQNSE